MTVAELIAELQKMPQDAEACGLYDGEAFCLAGANVMRAVPNRNGRTFTVIESAADARRHLVHIRPIVVIE